LRPFNQHASVDSFREFSDHIKAAPFPTSLGAARNAPGKPGKSTKQTN
jgi:hypothetical protein